MSGSPLMIYKVPFHLVTFSLIHKSMRNISAIPNAKVCREETRPVYVGHKSKFMMRALYRYCSTSPAEAMSKQ